MQESRDAGKQGCRKVGIQERRASRYEGCKFGFEMALRCWKLTKEEYHVHCCVQYILPTVQAVMFFIIKKDDNFNLKGTVFII